MDQPIAITMDAQELGALYASRIRPDQYNQLLLAKFKDAGAPVEGVLELYLAHGQLYKKKTDVLKPEGFFTYYWLPDELAARVNKQGGAA